MPASATRSSPARRRRSTAAAAQIEPSTAKRGSSSATNSATTAPTWSPPTLAASAAREGNHETFGRHGPVPHCRAQGGLRHPTTPPQPGTHDPDGDPAALAPRQPLALAAQAFAVVHARAPGRALVAQPLLLRADGETNHEADGEVGGLG